MKTAREFDRLRAAYEQREARERDLFRAGYRKGLERAAQYCHRHGLHWLGDDILKLPIEK